jgi:hypothetical protein
MAVLALRRSFFSLSIAGSLGFAVAPPILIAQSTPCYPVMAIRALAVRLTDDTKVVHQKWGLYDTRPVSGPCVANLVEQVARFLQLETNFVALAKDTSRASLDATVRAAMRYPTLWSISNARWKGDSLVVTAATTRNNHDHPPYSWSTAENNYYIVPKEKRSHPQQWTVARVQLLIISEGSCEKGMESYPPCS